MHKLYKLFFSPAGRISRIPFIIGIVGLFGFSMLQKFAFPVLGDGLFASFLLPMILFFVTFHIILCVIGKRLHDLGHTLWPLVGLIAIMIVISILVALRFGALEYINTIIAHPEYAGNEVAMKKELDIYQAKIDANMPKVAPLMSIAPTIFTLWLALAPSKKEDNKYGPPPSTIL